MPSKFGNLLNSFFAQRLTQQVKELYSATLILNFSVSAVTIFEPVFLYLLFIQKYGLAVTLQLVLWFYLGVYILYFFCVPLGAKFARRFGYERSIAVSTVFTALFYLSLFGSTKYFGLIFVAVILYVLWKMFYWPAYHSDFARFSAAGEQGRQISNLAVLSSAVAVLGPLVGGWLTENYGFKILFVFSALLMLLSNIPLLITKENFTPVSFSYGQALRRLWLPENRRRLLSLWGFGEELVVLTIWPIFIYVVVQDFFGLGALTALSILLTTIVFLYIGKATDKNDRRLVLRFGVVFYFFGWLFRLLTRGLFGVLAVDVFSRISKQAVAIPITAVTYEKAQDTSVMNTIVFFEMSLVLGKILAIILALVLLQFFAPGWNALFIMSALFSLLYLFFS